MLIKVSLDECNLEAHSVLQSSFGLYVGILEKYQQQLMQVMGWIPCYKQSQDVSGKIVALCVTGQIGKFVVFLTNYRSLQLSTLRNEFLFLLLHFCNISVYSDEIRSTKI